MSKYIGNIALLTMVVVVCIAFGPEVVRGIVKDAKSLWRDLKSLTASWLFKTGGHY